MVRMPASDLVCGCTISPSPGTRTTVPSIAITPAASSTRGQFSASSPPIRQPSPDSTSTRSRRSCRPAAAEVAMAGKPRPSSESSEVLWVERQRLDTLNVHPSIRLRIQHDYNDRTEPYYT
jgi:hypothetical protein